MNHKEFQRVWNDSETVHEVAIRLEKSYKTVANIASILRHEGLYLKKMHKTKTNLERARLTGAMSGRR